MDNQTCLKIAILIFVLFSCGCFFGIARNKEKFDADAKTMAPLNPKDDQKLPVMDEMLHKDPVDNVFDIEHDFYIARHKRGWWTDVINCQNTGNTSIYCKPKSLWIWPY